MFKRNIQLISFILYVSMCFVVFILFDKYANDNTVLFYIGIFLIITGIWGNITKYVFLKIPTGNINYKTINYLIILIGVLNLIIGLFFNCGFLIK